MISQYGVTLFSDSTVMVFHGGQITALPGQSNLLRKWLLISGCIELISCTLHMEVHEFSSISAL